MASGQSLGAKYPAGSTQPDADTAAAQIDSFVNTGDTVNQKIYVVSFDTTTQNYMDWPALLPEYYAGGAIDFELWWTVLATAGTVQFTLAGKKGSGSDLTAGAFGTPVNFSLGNAAGVARTLQKATVQLSAAAMGTPVAGDLIYLRLSTTVPINAGAKAEMHALHLIEA